MLSEKIKQLRVQACLSQEQLAEKLNVSRQAVTKWETGGGVPDIENLRALSALFCISLDELLENRAVPRPLQDFLFESVTEYDVDCQKDFDITFSGAHRVVLCGCGGEKVRVRLASNQLPGIQSAFKVKLDDNRRGIDLDVHRTGAMTEALAKEALHLFIFLPRQYLRRVELTGNTGALTIRELRAEGAEFSGKVGRVFLQGFSGHLELDSGEDMQIVCADLDGRLDVNQISCTSRLTLPEGTVFRAACRGVSNSISYQRGGRPAPDFSAGAGIPCENLIELCGLKSELVIASAPAPLEEV